MEKSVLIVSGEEARRELVPMLRELRAFNVFREVSTGADAIETAEKQKPDCILCDAALPDMPGYEFVRHIRGSEKVKDVPVMIIADSRDLAGSVEETSRCGADDFLTKPLNRYELSLRVRNFIRTRTLRDELRLRDLENGRHDAPHPQPAVPSTEEDGIQKINRMLSEKIHHLTRMISWQFAISATIDFDDLLDLIIAKSKEVMEVEAASLLLKDPESGDLYFAVAHSAISEMVKSHRIKMGQGIAGWVAQNGTPLIISDVQNDPRFFADVDRDTGFTTRNMMCVPLRHQGRVIGVMQVINKSGGREFTNPELDVFVDFATHVAIAIENSVLLCRLKETNTELNDRMRELATLLEVQAALSSTIEHDSLLELIIAKSKEVMGAEAASLMLLDRAVGELVFQVAQGEAGAAVKEIRVPVGQGIAGWVAENGEPAIVNDVQNDPRLFKKADEQSHFVSRNMICVPLKYKNEVTGVVQVLNKIADGDFTEADMRLFSGFASQAAMAIENVNLFNQRLEEERARREMRHILDSYVSPQVCEVLLENPDKLRLGGVRQQVTVLFSDIEGFTTLSEKHDPESVVSLLNDYLSEMVEIIFQHDGTLDKFMGDAIMALFGVPLSYGDDPERAIRAAVAMQEAMHRLRLHWAEEGRPMLHMGCSIHTGTAIVGNIGSSKKKDYTVIGDSVNVASRLQGLTRTFRKGIIISEDTRKLVPGLPFIYELDTVTVKGRTDPVKVFSVEPPELSGIPMLSR